jgi:ubiquinone/menaquinone biosynthesis C-methylase UbiE
MRPYQLHLSRGNAVLKDVRGRTQKFEKIVSVLKDFCQHLSPSICLDVGCSSGIMTSLLGEHFPLAIGMDIDQEAVPRGKGCSSGSRVHFLIADSMILPFQDNSVDVIVCNHVYEHVPDANLMMEEICRVLKKEGCCYFSAGNKYVIMEGHYRLPFLSWLPDPLGSLYLKMTGKGNSYYERHRSLRGLKRLVSKFQIHDYTLSIIRDPEKYCATDLFNRKSFSYRWIRRIAPYFYPWIPTYIWVLTKK